MNKKFDRIMLKVGGESLVGDREYGIDYNSTMMVAQKIKEVHDKHIQIAIVIGGGNIFRGLAAAKNGMNRTAADYMGMLATIMNGLALEDALEKVGVPTRVQSAISMPTVAEPYIHKKAIRHMEKGRVVILTGGTGVPYVTTDTGAALHALELNCDVLMKATKVNGIYEEDPKNNPNAKRFATLNFKDSFKMEGIRVMDTTALAMCKDNDMPIMVFKLLEEDTLLRAINGEEVGSYASNDVETKLV